MDEADPSPKCRRSQPGTSHVTRNAHVLPSCCIICGSSAELCVLDKQSKKRQKVLLTKCQLIHNDKLIKAAELRGDEVMLRKIRGQDLVAIEVQYHRTCHKTYTNVLYISKSEQSSVDGTAAYQQFCDKIVKQRIINDGELFCMNKLHSLYMEEVDNCETQENSKIEKRTLKKKLHQDFPQLSFIQPKHKNVSEIVMCEKNIPTILKEVVPEAVSEGESDSDDDFVHVPSVGKSDHFDPEQRHVLYSTGLALKNTVSNLSIHKKDKFWPPTADNVNLETAEVVVPPSLFNLLAWITNASEEVEFDKYVTVTDDKKRKILSIAQDIIFLAHNGSVFTPKHYALGLTIRHLCGSSKLNCVCVSTVTTCRQTTVRLRCQGLTLTRMRWTMTVLKTMEVKMG